MDQVVNGLDKIDSQEATVAKENANNEKANPSQNESEPEMNIILQSSRKAIVDEALCSICMEVIVDATVSNPCGHIFCSSCLYESSVRKKECPICRAQITSTTRSIPIDNMILGMIMRGDFRVDDCMHYLKRSGTELKKHQLKVIKRQCKRNNPEKGINVPKINLYTDITTKRSKRPKLHHRFYHPYQVPSFQVSPYQAPPYPMPPAFLPPNRSTTNNHTQGRTAEDAIILE